MFPTTKFQSRLRGIVDSANETMGCGCECGCPMQLRYDEYTMGADVMCEVMLRISGYVYLFVEGRFMDNKAILTVVNDDSERQQFVIDNEQDAQNMCDVVEQYVQRYLDTVISDYHAA